MIFSIFTTYCISKYKFYRYNFRAIVSNIIVKRIKIIKNKAHFKLLEMNWLNCIFEDESILC